MSDVITDSSHVSLHFSLALEDGTEVDSNFDAEPASFTMGDGSLLPGFEAALLGKPQGYAEQITLLPEQAFGEHNPANVQSIDKTKFGQLTADDLEEGLIVSFQAPDGELPGVVKAVYETNVLVDFNHPLSGKEIVFDVAVIKVVNPDETGE